MTFETFIKEAAARAYAWQLQTLEESNDYTRGYLKGYESALINLIRAITNDKGFMPYELKRQARRHI